MRHGLARLWWIGQITYDSSRQNPYELTEFISKNSDYIETIFGRNFSNNKTVLFALLDALVAHEKNGYSISRSMVRNVSEYLVQLGGIYIIDTWAYQEILEKAKNKLQSLATV